MLKLPLWFVTDPAQIVASKPNSEESPDTLVFSSWPKLQEFLAQSKVSASDVVVANDQNELLAIITDVRNRGGKAVYLDPDSDGYGGACIFLTNLESASE